MSSHHIVREDQEPALIIASMDAIDRENLGQLLEWSPTILTNDHVIDFLLAEDIKVDLVWTKQSVSYTQEQIVVLPLKEDYILEALAYLVASNYKAVNIVCDALDPRFLHFCEHINMVLLTPGRRTVFIQSAYEKWTEKGRKIYVDEASLKTFGGLRKVAQNEFETEQDGFFYLGFNSPTFVAVGEDL